MDEDDYYEIRTGAREFRERLQDLQELYELNEDEDITVSDERINQEVENVHDSLVELTESIEEVIDRSGEIEISGDRRVDLPKGLERTHGEFPGRGNSGTPPGQSEDGPPGQSEDGPPGRST